MAQLVVRNLPEDVKERLKRRAKRHGRSLEAEVRDILGQVPEPSTKTRVSARDWVDELSRRMQEIGVTDETIDELDEAIEQLRANDGIDELDP